MSDAATRNRSLALAEEIVAAGPGALTARDRVQLERLLLDHLGCAWRGANLPWGATLREWAAPQAGSGRAPLSCGNARGSANLEG